MTMNKAELIELVKQHGQYGTITMASEATNAVLDALLDGLVSAKEVKLAGFGTFEIKRTKAREGRNPRTGEKIQIPAKQRVVFKPSKTLLG